MIIYWTITDKGNPGVGSCLHIAGSIYAVPSHEQAEADFALLLNREQQQNKTIAPLQMQLIGESVGQLKGDTDGK